MDISVIDAGIGLRPEDQEKLFEALSQADGSAACGHEGTGLGLHLSQKLALLLGGCITFRSTYGQGSTFTVIIPQNDGSGIGRERRRLRNTPWARKKMEVDVWQRFW